MFFGETCHGIRLASLFSLTHSNNNNIEKIPSYFGWQHYQHTEGKKLETRVGLMNIAVLANGERVALRFIHRIEQTYIV